MKPDKKWERGAGFRQRRSYIHFSSCDGKEVAEITSMSKICGSGLWSELE